MKIAAQYSKKRSLRHVMLNRFRRAALVALFAPVILCSCDDQSAEVRELKEENGRLRKALEIARGKVTPPESTMSTAEAKADLNLTIGELWAQRFEDNQFRAKQRLDQKQIRVTGLIEAVRGRILTLYGTGTRIGSVSTQVQFDDEYAAQIQDGLASLQKGAQVTVQGRFLCDKMWLQDAVFVDRETGKRLFSKDLLQLNGQPVTAPSPPPAGDARPEQKD